MAHNTEMMIHGAMTEVTVLDQPADWVDFAAAAARWSHRNLLDNAYWANPDAIIDQRGGWVVPPGIAAYRDAALSIPTGGVTDMYYRIVEKTSTYGRFVGNDSLDYFVDWGAAVRGYCSWGYGHDCWSRISPNDVILITDDGVTIKSGSFCQHKIEKSLSEVLDGKPCTMSVLANGNLYSKSFVYNKNSYTEHKTTEFSVYCGGKVPGYNWNYPVFSVYANKGTDVAARACKLELGDKQTLAHQDASGNWVLNDPPPDKGMELLKCIQSTADPGDGYANKVVLHTGNKPSGSYTGNGSSAARTVNTGGMGNVVMIFGANGSALIVDGAGYSCSGGAVQNVLYSSAHFNNGTLYLATDHAALNANGVTYRYQVL